MTAYAEVWHFTRARLDQAIDGLTDAQMAWRPHDQAHSIYELLYHIAGAEFYWASRMGMKPPVDEFERKLDQAVIDGFLQERSFPFGPDEMHRRGVERALTTGFERLRPIIENPTEQQLAARMISPIGDDVDGRTGLTRIAQHGGYHTGQIWLMRMDPRFPE